MERLIDLWYKCFNILKFKCKGVVFGKKLRVSGNMNLVIEKNSKIIIGDNFNLISGRMYNSIGRNIGSCLRADDEAEISIGNNVGMSNVSIWAKIKIEIGNNVKIGADTIVADSDMHSLDYMQRRSLNEDVFNAKKKAIKIGNDVFIGTRSIICKGVQIGDRAIVGAGSVVACNIPSDEIWGGNPVKFIKKIPAKI
jgi:acetyltransferase-like isoleucine patch superfamily enzyme